MQEQSKAEVIKQKEEDMAKAAEMEQQLARLTAENEALKIEANKATEMEQQLARLTE